MQGPAALCFKRLSSLDLSLDEQGKELGSPTLVCAVDCFSTNGISLAQDGILSNF
jgi:hypothetical protein